MIRCPPQIKRTPDDMLRRAVKMGPPYAYIRNDPSFQVDFVDVLGRVASPSVSETQFALFKMTAKLGDGHRNRF